MSLHTISGGATAWACIVTESTTQATGKNNNINYWKENSIQSENTVKKRITCQMSKAMKEWRPRLSAYSIGKLHNNTQAMSPRLGYPSLSKLNTLSTHGKWAVWPTSCLFWAGDHCLLTEKPMPQRN